MKTTRAFFLFALAFGLATDNAAATDTNYFLHPPGVLWAVLGNTNFAPTSLAGTPEGAVVAGAYTAPPGPDLDYWAVVARIAGSPPAIVAATNFHFEGQHNWASDIKPVLGAGGALSGFVFAGARHRTDVDPVDPRITWSLPWLWVVRTDTSFVKQWESEQGTISHYTDGNVIRQIGSGYLVGGTDYIAPGASSGAEEWLLRLDSGGNLVTETNFGYAKFGGVFAIEPAGDGGYVLATGNGVIKVNAALTEQWRTNTADGMTQDYYKQIRRTADGDFVGLANRIQWVNVPNPPGSQLPVSQGSVLTRFSAGGSVEWSHLLTDAGQGWAGYDPTNGLPTFTPTVRGADFELAPDGGVILISTKSEGLNGGSDLWLVKLTPEGAYDWEKCVGGDGDDKGASIALASDGNYLLAGTADVNGLDQLWVMEVSTNLHAATPSFTITPASPVFRDQVVVFDARASTAPLGDAIADYRWDLGDGTITNGPVVAHAYRSSGTNIVTLTVTTTNGVSKPLSQTVEVMGLALQWERFLGDDDRDTAVSMVEARDGGFILTGNKSDDLWLLKTDRRGRLTWEKLINNGFGGTQEGFSIIRAQDSGYVVAGHDYHFTNSYYYDDAWLLKVDEAGELVWPIRSFGELFLNEQAQCVVATADGGYILGGVSPTNGLRCPWLVKTDADGNKLWERHCESGTSRWTRWLASTSDGGYLLIAEANAHAHLVFKTDALGVPVWTNTFESHDSWQWIAERGAPYDGFAQLGESGENIALRFFNASGAEVSRKSWTGMTTLQENDRGKYAARTPDGGYLIVGYVGLRPGSIYTTLRNDVALVKTDAEGNTHWVEFMPGTFDIHESGLAAVALTNGSYVVLGRRESGDSRVWLFKLAYNHPPIPQMQVATNVLPVGQPFSFDASASSDRDGTVALYEWDFGDGQTGSGALITHAYTNSGSYVVRFTAVDDDDAERSLTLTNYVTGVREESTGYQILNYSITNCPLCDPTNYPPPAVPLLVDWNTARGVRLHTTNTSASTKVIRITFTDPVPAGATLYRLPAWTAVPYTIVDTHTIEVRLWLSAYETNLAFVLGMTATRPAILASRPSASGQLALTFGTATGYRYRIERSPQLVPAAWTTALHSRTAGTPATAESLDGSGSPETVFVDLPEGESMFFRLSIDTASP
ncbi:MAG TPA: PKD domain-containing protein [Verrucomicrobiae bacterium]